MNGDGPREGFTVRQKKTRRAVVVPITNHSREALLLYLGERPARGGHPAPHDMDVPLFPSRKRGPDGELIPITRQQADRIIKKACRAVGLRDGTWATHTLRKTWGYHAYRAGTPLAVIQRKLGTRL